MLNPQVFGRNPQTELYFELSYEIAPAADIFENSKTVSVPTNAVKTNPMLLPHPWQCVLGLLPESAVFESADQMHVQYRHPSAGGPFPHGCLGSTLRKHI